MYPMYTLSKVGSSEVSGRFDKSVHWDSQNLILSMLVLVDYLPSSSVSRGLPYL
jgi:hypothetical protein